MYVKLFGTILSSSVWLEEPATRLVWITCLALADEDGMVGASVGGLAHQARVGEEECRKALGTLESPDKDSRSQKYEGRRLRKVEGGWEVLNYLDYRGRRTRKQVMDAARQARKRDRDRKAGESVMSRDITTEVEGEVEAERRV